MKMSGQDVLAAMKNLNGLSFRRLKEGDSLVRNLLLKFADFYMSWRKKNDAIASFIDNVAVPAMVSTITAILTILLSMLLLEK